MASGTLWSLTCNKTLIEMLHEGYHPATTGLAKPTSLVHQRSGKARLKIFTLKYHIHTHYVIVILKLINLKMVKVNVFTLASDEDLVVPTCQLHHQS